MKNAVLGIEFDGNIVRIVECDGTPTQPRVLKAVSTVVTLDSQAMMTDKESFLAKFLRDELRKNDIKSKQATLGIINNDLYLKYIQMPPLPKNRFIEALTLQSSELLEIELDNFYYEHRFLGQIMENNNIQNRYMIAAARKTMIDEYLTILSTAGISLVDINATVFYASNLLNESYKTGTYVLVYLGYENGYVVIYKNGIPQFARKVKVRKMYEEAHELCSRPLPENDREFGEGVLDQFSEMLLNETLGTVNYYHMVDDEYMPNDFVFMGYGSNKKDLVETVQSKINLPVIKPPMANNNGIDYMDDYSGALGAAITGLGVRL